MKKIKHVERKESRRNLNVSKCDRTECFVEKLYFFLKYPLKKCGILFHAISTEVLPVDSIQAFSS